MGLTSYQLKWIGIITMMTDHIGAILFPKEMIFRIIGRLSFPIFCFLLTEGVRHTHDIRMYMLRLAGFALLSEVPYDLAFYEHILDFRRQNVYFTLLLGVILLYLLENTGMWPIKAAEVLLVMWMAEVLRVDYGYEGILLIGIFCLLRGHLCFLTAGAVFWNFLFENRLQLYGALAVIPIMLYSGERGKKMKYFFYIFYPMHLSILYMVDKIL